MSVVEVDRVSYSYGAHDALRDLSLSIPEGALYALLGPNGSGKTTLLQILMGLRRAKSGRVSVFGVDSASLTVHDRAAIGYIAEGQSLPGWMRLEQLEAYLAPLYPTWDRALADHLRDRFELDPKAHDQVAFARPTHEGGAALRARTATEAAADGRALHRHGCPREGRVGARPARVGRQRRLDGPALLS